MAPIVPHPQIWAAVAAVLAAGPAEAADRVLIQSSQPSANAAARKWTLFQGGRVTGLGVGPSLRVPAGGTFTLRAVSFTAGGFGSQRAFNVALVSRRNGEPFVIARFTVPLTRGLGSATWHGRLGPGVDLPGGGALDLEVQDLPASASLETTLYATRKEP